MSSEIAAEITRIFENEQHDAPVASHDQVPASASLTVEWLNDVLCRDAPQARVDAFQLDHRDDGSSHRQRISTRHDAFEPPIEAAELNDAALQRLSAGDFRIMIRTRAVDIEQDALRVCPACLSVDTHHLDRIPAEAVVFVSHNRPSADLLPELERSGIAAQAVGDAHSPRFLQVAIREGRMAGMAI